MTSMMRPCPLDFRFATRSSSTAGLLVVVFLGFTIPVLSLRQNVFGVFTQDLCGLGPDSLHRVRPGDVALYVPRNTSVQVNRHLRVTDHHPA